LTTEPAGFFEFSVDADAASDGTATVLVRGELDLSTASQLRDRLFGLLEAGTNSVTLDVSGLSFIDSTGLGVIVAVVKRARQQGGNLVLRGPSRSARKVIDISGLSQIVEIID
jgi:anti-sigma B factor antagonist